MKKCDFRIFYFARYSRPSVDVFFTPDQARHGTARYSTAPPSRRIRRRAASAVWHWFVDKFKAMMDITRRMGIYKSNNQENYTD